MTLESRKRLSNETRTGKVSLILTTLSAPT